MRVGFQVTAEAIGHGQEMASGCRGRATGLEAGGVGAVWADVGAPDRDVAAMPRR